MNIYTIISIVTTVLSFLAFLGIVGWAYSKHRRAAFDEAASAPFALPEDGTDSAARSTTDRAERRP